jgi:hypothetical protein
VVTHCNPAIDELFRREIFVILWKALLDDAAKQRLIPGRRDLIVVRKAGRIYEGRVAHAQGVGLVGHKLGKLALVAAKVFRNCYCNFANVLSG